MASTNKIKRGDDEVYEAVDANLASGVLVIPSTTATKSGNQGIKVATAGALDVLGVSSHSAVTAANQAASQSGDGADGYPFANTAVPSELVTVYSHCIVRLNYTAVAVAFGVRLKAAAGGGVAAWVSGADSAAAIIGWCAEPGGVSSAGGNFRVRLNV